MRKTIINSMLFIFISILVGFSIDTVEFWVLTILLSAILINNSFD